MTDDGPQLFRVAAVGAAESYHRVEAHVDGAEPNVTVVAEGIALEWGYSPCRYCFPEAHDPAHGHYVPPHEYERTKPIEGADEPELPDLRERAHASHDDESHDHGGECV